MSDEERLATIRRLNLLQDLPSQERDHTIFNGALFEIATLESILLPPYNFTYPLSDYSPTEIPILVREYGFLTAQYNSSITYSVDIPLTNNQFFTLITREVNRSGFWCLVQRSIFLHRPHPLATVDVIAPSSVLAAGHTPAPPDTCYRRPADIGEPASARD